MKNVLKSLIVWLMIIPIAILNGGLRDKVLTLYIGDTISYPMSGILLCIFILMLTIFILPKFVRGRYCIIGILWAVLTVLFEFSFGFANNMTTGEMLKAYDITTGNLWLLIVVFTGFAPWLGVKIRKIV